MARSPEQTTNWVAELLKERCQKTSVQLTSQILQVMRDDYPPFNAAIISAPQVTAAHVQPFVAGNHPVEVIVNVPKESFWDGDAIKLAQTNTIAFGGVGDLMSVSSQEHVRSHVRSEYRFIEEGLMQHDKVLSLDREYDRIYLIHRNGLKPLRFVALNEYELTGDHIRTAKRRYGSFDLVLLNNPNGQATSSALDVAEGFDVRILKWKQLLGRLNSP